MRQLAAIHDPSLKRGVHLGEGERHRDGPEVLDELRHRRREAPNLQPLEVLHALDGLVAEKDLRAKGPEREDLDVEASKIGRASCRERV